MFGFIDTILRRIKKELGHFTALPFATRLLVISFSLRNIAYPLIGMFTSAYIWRVSNDVTLLIFYNIGNFAILPVMFLVNAKLLKYIRLPYLYSLGTVLTGVSALMVVFYRVTTPEAYVLYGIIYGVGNGIYWANRNFLTLKHTASESRSYITGLLFTQGTLSSIIVPTLAGWIIVLSRVGYEVLVVTAFVILLIAGTIIHLAAFESPVLHATHSQPYSLPWKRTRLYAVAIGAIDVPLYILPTVLVLATLGNEAVLGTVTSILAVITAVVTYVFGRKQQKRYFRATFIGLIGMFMLAGVGFIWGVLPSIVLWYTVITSIADNLIWTALMPVLMDGQDEESTRSGRTHYDVIVNTEWCINFGRIMVLGAFLALSAINIHLALKLITILSGIVAYIVVGLASKQINSK